ncbi:MAG: PucR family transcriptional regulator [Lachnospiraceae bacterium]
MALTVSEIRELPVAEAFRLVAGASGLNRKVEHVNLLDFEYDTWEPDARTPDGIFDEKSIIITSLLFAKECPEKIIRVVRQLYVDGVSALAVKAVYYKELPEAVIRFADENAFPIFLFDSEKNFSENVVVGLTMAIEENENIDGLEEKVAFLLQDNLGKLNRYKLLEELFPELETPFQCFYFFLKDMHTGFSYRRKLLKLRSRKSRKLVILPYQYGILVTAFGNVAVGIRELETELELTSGQYVCGVSRSGSRKEELGCRIQESLYACNYGRSRGREFCCFDEIGIWQIILPNRENFWMKSYCNGIVERLKNYDADGGCELYDTIVRYVNNAYSINRTAEEMMLHKNTVRYRVSKAREALGLEKNEAEFHVTVFLAVQFDQINL